MGLGPPYFHYLASPEDGLLGKTRRFATTSCALVRSFFLVQNLLPEGHLLVFASDFIYAIPKFTISREKHGITFLEFLRWVVGVGKLQVVDVRRDNPLLRQHSPPLKANG